MATWIQKDTLMQTVELHHVFSYHCEECGELNYVPAITVEMSEEEMKERREIAGIPEQYTCIEFRSPYEVTCPHCRTSFETD